MKEINENFDSRIEFLNNLIQSAKNNALDDEHHEILKNSLNNAESLYSQGEMSEDKYKDKVKFFLDRTNFATIHINNISDFKKVLEIIGLKDEKLHSMLNHENAHANKAEYSGQKNISYNITVTKDDDKMYHFYPYVISSIEGDLQESNNISNIIAQASEDAGDVLSEYDKNIIKTKK